MLSQPTFIFRRDPLIELRLGAKAVNLMRLTVWPSENYIPRTLVSKFAGLDSR